MLTAGNKSLSISSWNEFQCFFSHLSGSVKVWDPRQKEKPVANMAPAEGEEGRDCWCVAFGKKLACIFP